MVNIKKKHFIINTALWAVINKKFINKECTFPATSVFKNKQTKKIIYGHSSQLSSQKLLWLQPLNNMGASSLLPPLQEVYSQFQVLWLKCSQQREVKSQCTFLQNWLKNLLKQVSQGNCILVLSWIVQSQELYASAWSGSTQSSRPQRNCFRTTTCPSFSTYSKSFYWLPRRSHSGKEESHRVHWKSLSFSYISVRAYSGHIPFDFLILMNSQTSAELSVWKL